MKSKLLLSLILLLFAGRALCATAPPTLSLLQISGQTLSPAFDPNITSYTLTTTSGTPTVTLKPEVWVAANSGITITINGTKVASAAGTASPSFSVSDGNYISVVVTAPDGVTQQTYNVEINVNVLAPEMAALTSLSIVGQTLLSANGGPIDYSPNNPSGFISIVDYDSSSIQVEAVAGGTDQRITINGKSVAQGVASPPIPLKVGSNSIIISVTTPNGNGANYAITVTREPSSIATLKSVKIIGPGISATDTIGTTDGFNPTIPYAASSISLTAISTDTTANITISYHANFAGKGQAGTGAISLDVGPNVVSIIVTAQDGMTTKTYNFTFTRQPPSTSLNLLQISGETISPKFATNTTSYGSTVATSTTSVKVEAYTNDPNATLTVNGTTVASGAASQSIPLVFGANNIAVIVTGADKVSTQTYTISVTRPESSDATLALLLVGGQTISPTFSSAITSYTSTVPNTTTAVKIDAYCDPYATMTVNGTVTASGVASQSIPLVVGPNTITTTVTAQAGNTETYTIIITRLPSNIATLSLFLVGGQTISPAFNSATTSYTTTVLSTTASVKVEAFTSQPNATIIVNGIAVASGTASQSIPLTFGNNTITTVVIAQDGVTTDTYTSTVIRQPSNIATLMLLQISGQTISPAFNSATTSYTSTVSNATASVKIGVFTSNANATVTVNGTAVASGAASQSIPLLIGANTITTVVTAQDGVTTDTYTITLTRLPSNIAALALLQISGQTISPAFNAATTSYTSTVSNATTSVKVEAFCASYSAITVNGTAVTSGVASQSIPLAIGPNTITTVITAQDGVTTNTYTIIVTRLPSNIATLALLQISGQTLSPVFTTATTSYTSTVASTTTSVKVEAFVNNANATIKVNGIAVVSGAASQSIPLVLGSNTITTVVTAQDGATTDTYTINVIRPPSNVATLTALQINGIPIPLNYSSASTSYSTTVPNIIASLSVVAYLSNPNATITVDGFTIASGVALPNIPLSVGNNTVTVVVLAQDGVTKDTYSVTVTRLPSSIATLSLLQISGQTISPAFSASTTSYASTVPSTTASVNVEAFATNANETITVNGTSVASATLSQSIPLAFGSNTITTAVTAQDGVTRQTYTITVTRPLSNIATLALLQVSGATLSPTFNAATTAYTSTVANTVASVKVEGTTTSANATMTVNGTVVASATLSQSIPLVVGSNTITTIVTAQDGVTKQTYTVTVTRQPATIATLTLLQVSGASLSPAFATATTSYTTTVPGTTASVNVEAYTTNANATITVNGTAVASATLSQSIPLTFGNNTITTVVTAQDGVTTDTYTIMVTREPSAIATLNLLQISGETISPTFSTATTSYTSNVPNTISSVAVVAYTSNSFATITVNGTAVTSGAASPALPLNVGANTITTVVTAQDGATTDTYTITVTRAAPSTALRGIDINGVFHPENSFVNDDNIAVHTAVSPNGDGVNDVLTIDGISAYPDNTLTLMNQGGAIIYQAKGYDNYSRAFDGHSNKTGAMQSPGTYFYMLQYKVGDQTKSKTGYIVLKY